MFKVIDEDGFMAAVFDDEADAINYAYAHDGFAIIDPQGQVLCEW